MSGIERNHTESAQSDKFKLKNAIAENAEKVKKWSPRGGKTYGNVAEHAENADFQSTPASPNLRCNWRNISDLSRTLEKIEVLKKLQKRQKLGSGGKMGTET